MQRPKVWFLFLILVLVGATSLLTAAENTGGIKGQILSMDEKTPVEGMKILIGGEKTFSDEKGDFALDNLPSGDYLLHPTSARFLNQVIGVRVKPGEITSLTINAKLRTTKLEGFIVDEEGNPVIGVEIYTNPEIDETKTDEKGHFLFNKKRLLDETRRPIGKEPIPSGEYTVFAQKLQYTKAEKKITIIRGLRNNLGTLAIAKIGVPTTGEKQKRLESPTTIDEPTQGAGEVKLD